MNAGGRHLLMFARSGMELSWRYAWAVFLVFAAARTIYPLPAALFTFSVAAIATRWAAGKTWRIYQVLLLKTAGFCICALVTLYPIQARSWPLISLKGMTELLLGSKTPLQWLILSLMLICQLIIWRGGTTLFTNSKSYFAICLQFDKGLGLLFLLLIVRSVVGLKGGPLLPSQAVGFPTAAFLIFSLISIGLARNQDRIEKSFLAGYRGVGLILSVCMTAVVFGAGASLLIYPFLHHVADKLLVILESGTQPMVPYLIRVLLFFLRPRQIKKPNENPDALDLGGDTPVYPEVDTWQSLTIQGIGWGLLGMMALMVLAALWFLLVHLFRLLLRRQSKQRTAMPARAVFSAFFNLMRLLFWRRWRGSVDSAALVYAGMLRWGRRCGLPPVPSETPAEYGNRLTGRFPKLRQEIGLIVEAFNSEIYGQIETGPDTLARLLTARRKMAGIRQWPLRMKAWLSV